MTAPVLMDTHVLVWCAVEPERLSLRARRAVEGAAMRYISTISAWELTMLARKGRLELSYDPATWLASVLADTATLALPITAEIGIEAASLDWSHADPADRLIAATARHYRLSLVTADEELRDWKGVRTTW